MCCRHGADCGRGVSCMWGCPCVEEGGLVSVMSPFSASRRGLSAHPGGDAVRIGPDPSHVISTCLETATGAAFARAGSGCEGNHSVHAHFGLRAADFRPHGWKSCLSRPHLSLLRSSRDWRCSSDPTRAPRSRHRLAYFGVSSASSAADKFSEKKIEK